MPVSNAPIYTQSAILGVVQISTANANLDGSTGTYSSALSVGANGALIDSITVKGAGTTGNGMVRIFVSPDGGTTWRLRAEIPTTASTPSATVAAFSGTWTPEDGIPLSVTSTTQFKFSTVNAETYNVFLKGANF